MSTEVRQEGGKHWDSSWWTHGFVGLRWEVPDERAIPVRNWRTGEGDQRGGGEWESIKIPLRNLAYIPNSTRRPSLLTRSRPHSYSKAVGLRNRVRNSNENTTRCRKNTCEVDGKNQVEKQFISLQAFHRISGGRVRETITRERFKPWILKSFDPVTQELCRHLPAMIHTQAEHNKKILSSNLSRQDCAVEPNSQAVRARTNSGRCQGNSLQE
jgi:hypothetical protein